MWSLARTGFAAGYTVPRPWVARDASFPFDDRRQWTVADRVEASLADEASIGCCRLVALVHVELQRIGSSACSHRLFVPQIALGLAQLELAVC